MQTQESKIDTGSALDADPGKALDASLVVTECSGTKSDKHDTSNSSRTYLTHAVDADIKPVNDQVPFAEMQTQESKIDTGSALDADPGKALDASLVVTECSGTKSDKHDTSNSSRTYLTHAVDAHIRLVNDQVPFAEASLFNDKMTSVHISSGLALQQQMTSVHISSGLALHRQMASADITSGPAPQIKERCTLQCALSLKEESIFLFTRSTSQQLLYVLMLLSVKQEDQVH
ncbi:hypothetical protein Tco_0201891 [Tanacetum coccineum]